MGDFVWFDDLTRVMSEKLGYTVKREDILALRRREGGLEVLFRHEGKMCSLKLTSAVQGDG